MEKRLKGKEIFDLCGKVKTWSDGHSGEFMGVLGGDLKIFSRYSCSDSKFYLTVYSGEQKLGKISGISEKTLAGKIYDMLDSQRKAVDENKYFDKRNKALIHARNILEA